MTDDDDEALKRWDASLRSMTNLDSPIDHAKAPTVSRIRKNDENIVSGSKFASDLHHHELDRQDVDDDDDHTTIVDDQVTSSQQNLKAEYLSLAANSPDHTFAATDKVKLSRGTTAYRLINQDPQYDSNGNVIEPITIVCLHGLLECSYVWEDLAEVLSIADTGPHARILVFDFYGHGRSEEIAP